MYRLAIDQGFTAEEWSAIKSGESDLAGSTAADTRPGLAAFQSSTVWGSHPLTVPIRASGSDRRYREWGVHRSARLAPRGSSTGLSPVHHTKEGGGPTAMRDGQTCGCAFGLNAVSIARHIVRKQKPSCRPAPTVCAGKCCTARSCLALRSPTCS